ncbi:acetyltransferase [Vibrio cyclitrophicus FF160]|uniref:acyltransferase n=1 Tax=Vibrio cyclitrophicus TaxID=47951 RepID=UPI000362788B|nr:acyltransferase [Vibrio cyclitrophicus]OEE81586.1 acetyltransferase [Vibrio cyclitrophicus FF160]
MKILIFIRYLVTLIRKKSYFRVATKGVRKYEEPLKINGKATFNGNTFLGKNCHFNGIEVSGGGIFTVGDNFHSGKHCQIITQNHNIYGNALPYDDTYIYKDVVIGDNVWIGNNVIILGGVTIGEGCVIQAGSVVVSDIPECSIAGGHPAKIFGRRDIRHYQDRKQKKQFT